ncbi:MAG: pitrilysin family protein [Bacteroidota bacterium]
MISFEKFTLNNGLKVIVHPDASTQLVAINILYNVGARDEDPDKTGFAHLFEHLMFGGSVNIEDYDEPLQMAGGDNNAWTNNDVTDYYLTLPANNMETGFWLESDRMLSLAFSPKSLEVQRSVVIEEFKQRYLNQPYGDVWLLLRPLVYQVHPYSWSTIGKEISHIENATLDDVKDFFRRYYCPDNAILVVAGNVQVDDVRKLCEKWFAPIPKGNVVKRTLPQEPVQEEARHLEVTKNVPVDALYKAYHCCSRLDKEFYATELMTDLLSRGQSSRLYNSLVKERKLFSKISCFVTGDLDKGMVVVEGRVAKGITIEEADKGVVEELEKFMNDGISDDELTKVKNKLESSLLFEETNVADKALNLAFWELIGGAENINKEIDYFFAVSKDEIIEESKRIFRKTNCSTLYYRSNLS